MPTSMRRLLSMAQLMFLAVCLTILTGTTSLAAPQTTRIELPTRTLAPADDGAAWLFSRDPQVREGVIVQFRDHLDASAKRQLALDGIELHEYLGGGAWAALVQAELDPTLASRYPLRWAGPLLTEDKLHPRVLAGEVPPWADTPEGILYAVAFFKGVDEAECEAVLHTHGAEPGEPIPILHTWYTRGGSDLPTRLAKDPRVLYVTFVSPGLESLNAGVREWLVVNPLHDPAINLTGAGETVLVYDGDAVDPTHPDFGNRVTVIEPLSSVSDHPTHVAGTLGGNGDDAHRGVAPGVTILSSFYESCTPNCLYDSPNDIHDDYQLAYTQHGARIFTNSIGANIAFNGYPCSWEGDYEITSALLDSLVRGPFGDPMTIVWAAGNERTGNCGSTYSTMGVPANAKNTIVVGAVTDSDNMTTFSSWGPSDDGRLRPDVVGPGHNVVSCAFGGGYTQMSGTSMSTPGVAGVVALLHEAWHDVVNPATTPLPSTTKAILANTADDLGNTGPDYAFGHGRVNAFRAVGSLQFPSFIEDVVSDDEVLTYEFEVPEGTPRLDVSLAWSDPPAGYLPPLALVNDLNLALRNPSDGNHFAWRLNPNQPSAPATRGINSLDNLEKVTVNNPEPGTWTILVQGFDVPGSTQEFSIASSLPLGEGYTRVSGQVVAAGTGGQGVPGVEIRLDDAGDTDVVTQTSETGAYTAWVQMDGDMPIHASAPGYLPQMAWVIDQGQAGAVVNFLFFPGDTGLVGGVVRNSVGDAIQGATVEVLELPDLSATTNANGIYMLDLPAGDPLTLRASNGPIMDERQVYLTPDEERQVDFLLAQEAYQITGPDAHGYLAIQSGDNHPLAPEYDWVEIDPDQGGPGTRVPTSTEDNPILVTLPFDFGYYGVVYDRITVNENGMFAFGDLSGDPDGGDYSNEGIPDEDGPPAMVAPFWEDFNAPETNLSYYADPAGRFIVEWFDSRQYPVDGTRETFQVILYDTTAFPTGSIDGSIKFQYADVNDPGNATFGIEDDTETIGIQLAYFDNSGDGEWGPQVQPITDESAVLFAKPLGSVTGMVTLDPPDGDVVVRARIGDLEADLENDGSYHFPSVPLGLQVVEVGAAGYERREVAVEVIGGPATAPPVTLSRFYSPSEVSYTELNGDAEEGAAISWAYNPGETDEFTGQFRVYRNGLPIAQTDQLAYDDTTPITPDRTYWVTAVFEGGESDTSNHAVFLSDVRERLASMPDRFEVSPAWPNPFNPSTAVTVSLPDPGALTVTVVDLLGREVATLVAGERMQAGHHRLSWDARDHASGMYFIRVQHGEHLQIRKAMLLK